MKVHPIAAQFADLALEVVAASHATGIDHTDPEFEAIVRGDVIDRVNLLVQEACPAVEGGRVMTPLWDGVIAALTGAVAVAHALNRDLSIVAVTEIVRDWIHNGP